MWISLTRRFWLGTLWWGCFLLGSQYGGFAQVPVPLPAPVFSEENYGGTNYSQGVGYSHLAKLFVVPIREHGSGFLVGADSQFVYLVTAGHVVKPLLEREGQQLQVSLFKTYPNGQTAPLDPVVAVAVVPHDELDLALVKVPRPSEHAALAPAKSYVGPYQGSLPAMVKASAYVEGFAGSSKLRPGITPGQIDSLLGMGQFRLAVEASQGGYSGSPVFMPLDIDRRPNQTSPDIWVGTAVSILPDGQQVKVISIQEIVPFLQEHQVPMNWLTWHDLLSVPWEGYMQVQLDTRDLLKLFTAGQGMLYLHPDGRVTGVGEGTYQLGQQNITFYFEGDGLYLKDEYADGHLERVIRNGEAYQLEYRGIYMHLLRDNVDFILQPHRE